MRTSILSFVSKLQNWMKPTSTFEQTPATARTTIRGRLKEASAAAKRQDWQEAVRLYELALEAYGGKVPQQVQVALNNARRARSEAETYRKNKLIFRAVADPDKLVWVKLDRIIFKVTGENSRSLHKNHILPGDWDLLKSKIEDTVKYRAIIQHFRDGMQWEETDLFRIYAERLSRGDSVRGCETILELKRSYELTVDQLYIGLQQRGFLLPRQRNREANDLPHIHIARDGEIIFGNGGNHRFAMAKLLGIDRMPCIVHARHLDWQNVRERVLGNGIESATRTYGPSLAHHPDLADIWGGDEN